MGSKRTKSKEAEAERAEALAELRKRLRPGDTVYTVLHHCARSGMSRSISLLIGRRRYIQTLDWHAMRALGYRLDQKHGGLVVGGCGMDMGYHLVYNLGRAIWPNGTAKPHGYRNGEPDSDGGYALKHRWL